jgi:hypothetical protein
VTLFARLTLLLALSLSGCSVSLAELSPSDVALNQCSTDADCPGGRCQDKLCLGTGGTLTSLLVSVTPPPTVAGINSLTYYTNYPNSADTGTPGAGGGALTMNLDDLVDVSGTFSIDTTNCSPVWASPAGGSNISTSGTGAIPADLTFTPSEHAFGVPTDDYSGTLTLSNDVYGFSRTLPPGNYDVYIKPHYQLASPMDLACQVPPSLLLNQPVASVTPTFKVKLPPHSTLKVDVTWPFAAPYADDLAAADPFFANPLAGWTLDLVDPSTGRVLSTEPCLGSADTCPPGQPFVGPKTAPISMDTSVTYEVTLVYAPVYAPVKGGGLQPTDVGSEVLRLTPPATRNSLPFTAPTILAQLDGALVAADGSAGPAQIVQSTVLPAPVTVEFQTALASDGTPVAAGVLLTATQIDGIDGLSTAFSRAVQVDTSGLASVDLLPGSYRVIATAKNRCTGDSCLGQAETDWVVAKVPSSQAGKLIEFSPATNFDGSAWVNGHRPATGATVTAVGSALLVDSNLLNLGDGSVAVTPQATSGLVDSDGSFSFQADAGAFDLRVEPDPSTGYGWFVRPGLNLPADSDELGELDLDLPIVYTGVVTVASNGKQVPIPSALIRAYVYLKPDGTVTSQPVDGAVAVQVAETYSEGEGSDVGAFKLLIPPNLATP